MFALLREMPHQKNFCEQGLSCPQSLSFTPVIYLQITQTPVSTLSLIYFFLII